jgi:phage shock protein A
MVLGQQEIAASSLDNQFNELDELDAGAEVEARLALLKSGGTPKAIED